MTSFERSTSETKIRVAMGDDVGPTRVDTGIPFLDHMLVTLARYAGLEIVIEAEGDLRHHVSEDVAITLGRALADATPAACRRFGEATIPMDDALVQCALDLGGRAFYGGRLRSARYDHFMRSLADNVGMTLHLRVLRGRDRHHVIEAAFKALGLSLRHARATSDDGAVFSTKGAVVLEKR